MALALARFSQHARLTKASENNPSLHQGEKGPFVQALQLGLIDLGFPMPKTTAGGTKLADGTFGEETAACVRGLQKSAGLTVDAVVGRQTLAVLEARILALTNEQAASDAIDTRRRAQSKTLNSLVD